jgi:hypothetical protein
MSTWQPIEPKEWCWDPMPAVDDWFAVIRCWEVEEGMFAGVVWADKGVVREDGGMTSDGSGHAGPFATKAEAQAWADAHDPEGSPAP